MKKALIISLIILSTISTAFAFVEGTYKGTATVITPEYGIMKLETAQKISKINETTYQVKGDTIIPYIGKLLNAKAGRTTNYDMTVGKSKYEYLMNIDSKVYGEAVWLEFEQGKSITGSGSCLASICDYSIEFDNGEKMVEQAFLDMERGEYTVIGKLLNADGSINGRWHAVSTIVEE